MAKDTLTAVTWNVRNTHSPEAVHLALKRIIEAHSPDVIALQECYHLHGHLTGLGYKVVQDRPSDQSESAECALLVRVGLSVQVKKPLQMKRRWKGPKAGVMHDPRRYPQVRLHRKTDWKVLDVHLPFGQAPKRESERRIRRWLRWTTSKTAAIVVGDWNETTPVVQDRVSRPSDARIIGERIDHAVYKNCRLIRSVQLGKYGSDHRALLFQFVR